MSKTNVDTYLFARWLVIGLCVGLTVPAWAAGPGSGIHLGEATVVSPALQLNAVYDSNVASVPQGLVRLGSPAIEVKPSLDVKYKQELVRLELSYEQKLRLYMASEAAQYSFLDDVGVRGIVDLLPQRMIGFMIRDDFAIRNFPNRGEDTDVSDANLLKRRYNSLWAEGRYSPGSALDVLLAVHWLYDLQDYFNQGDVSRPDSSNAPFKNEFGAQAKGRWRFFPKTALLAQLDVSSGRWQNLVPSCDNGSCFNKSDQNTMWDFQAGVAGQFTSTVQANLFLGYGGLYNAAGTSAEPVESVTGFDGLMAQSQVVYSPQSTQNFSLSFMRRFSDSASLDYSISSAFGVGYNGVFFERISTNAGMAFDFRRQNAVNNAYSRRDFVFKIDASLDYRITPWLWFNAAIYPSIVLTSPIEGLSEKSADELCDLYCSSRFIGTLGVRGVY